MKMKTFKHQLHKKVKRTQTMRWENKKKYNVFSSAD